MLRSKSKDRVNEDGGLFMSKTKMGEYLHELRAQKPTRPTGARPPPTSFVSKRYSTSNLSTASSLVKQLQQEEPGQNPADATGAPPRCASAQSFYRKPTTVDVPEAHKSAVTSVSALNMGRPLARPPPEVTREADLADIREDDPLSLPYLERGQRWLERQEAHSLRRALEDMDVKKGEGEVFVEAQKEAAELVWKHQNPQPPHAPYQNPEAKPNNYREHLRKGSNHARTTSWAQTAQDIQARQLKRRSKDSSTSRSVSGGSKSSSNPSSRIPSDSSLKVPHSPITPDDESVDPERQPQKRSVQFVELGPDPEPTQSVPRKLSRSRSRSPSKTDPATAKSDKQRPQARVPSISNIAAAAVNTIPANFRNPFSRARLGKGTLTRVSTEPTPITKPLERIEIQRNPPTQTRNPLYTINNEEIKIEVEMSPREDVKMKDGKEIRSDDIRKATSMSVKDRSAKLPTPTMVSDSPGRPIVSFHDGWKPKQIELKQELSNSKSQPPTQIKAYPQSSAEKPLSSPKKTSMQASGEIRERTSPPPTHAPLIHAATEPVIPTRRSGNMPLIPTIAVSAMPAVPLVPVNEAAPPIPTFSFNDGPSIPSIAVSGASNAPGIAVNDVPSFAVSAPSISVSAPSFSVSAPSDSVSGSSPSAPRARPLPTPSSSGARPGPRHTATAPASTMARPHVTPTGHAHSRSTGALCNTCGLSIQGRTLSAAGGRFHPECFRCNHCGEGLECVAFYPEPENFRQERVARIHARMAGHVVEGYSEHDDGDESLRFYCHLDFHEFFSPRCKSCKTPIEGEVVVACGAEWHVGHFFCAQCGDPFDSKTPFVEKDGYAWCCNCHTNRFSTKCKKCRKPVTDTVVKALDAEWHEQCFCCTECGGRFVDGQYFLRQGCMDPFCSGCEQQRLKA